jgi:hypothetical protein
MDFSAVSLVLGLVVLVWRRRPLRAIVRQARRHASGAAPEDAETPGRPRSPSADWGRRHRASPAN